MRRDKSLARATTHERSGALCAVAALYFEVTE